MVGLTPTFNYIASIKLSSCSLPQLQTKAAFLLGMAALLRHSDLAWVSLLSATVNEELKLRFNIVAPKNAGMEDESSSLSSFILITLAIFALYMPIYFRTTRQRSIARPLYRFTTWMVFKLWVIGLLRPRSTTITAENIFQLLP
ncbi:hypothetical protein BCV72DRAFT_321677 [Rhizopus microsporus var. microsporus]|uniref:Uncharacterized protein n=1 Tax=Rhizopus microsporus var. microsporus TaxID=86635 RepID=A0A1X0RAR7_RHIZD|nr:hypothetical protein BCV72DRAFT_321677 [Rhizopus microsporus var. microsporus]